MSEREASERARADAFFSALALDVVTNGERKRQETIMSERLTSEREATIRARVAAALAPSDSAGKRNEDPSWDAFCPVWVGGNEVAEVLTNGWTSLDAAVARANAIASAPHDCRDLLAEIDALRAERDEARGLLSVTRGLLADCGAERGAAIARVEALRSRLCNLVDETVRPMHVLTAEEALGALERGLPAQRIACAQEVAAMRARAEAAEGTLAACVASVIAYTREQSLWSQVQTIVMSENEHILAVLHGPAATIAAEHDRRVRAEALEGAADDIRTADLPFDTRDARDWLRDRATALRGGA